MLPIVKMAVSQEFKVLDIMPICMALELQQCYGSKVITSSHEFFQIRNLGFVHLGLHA